jgi:hypothetical protein
VTHGRTGVTKRRRCHTTSERACWDPGGVQFPARQHSLQSGPLEHEGKNEPDRRLNRIITGYYMNIYRTDTLACQRSKGAEARQPQGNPGRFEHNLRRHSQTKSVQNRFRHHPPIRVFHTRGLVHAFDVGLILVLSSLRGDPGVKLDWIAKRLRPGPLSRVQDGRQITWLRVVMAKLATNGCQPGQSTGTSTPSPQKQAQNMVPTPRS